MTIVERDDLEIATGDNTPEIPVDIRTYLLSRPDNPKSYIFTEIDWNDQSNQIIQLFQRESKFLHDEVEVVQERINNFDNRIPKKSKHSNNPLSKRVERDIKRNKKQSIETLGKRLHNLNSKIDIVEGRTITPITLLEDEEHKISGYRIGVSS